MKLKINLLIVMWALTNNAFAMFEGHQFSSEQLYCYSKAMVGMDSVINAKLGMPPEHAVDLVLTDGNTKVLNNPESVKMLNIILNAYFWTESPHGYAIKVFYQCAVSEGNKASTAARELAK